MLIYLLTYSSTCNWWISPISLQSVFYFHEQEGKMGSYMKEKEMHLHLSQHKFLNVILKKN